MNDKKNILIIFGGKSGEHEVSVNSAKSIESNIDQTKYTTCCLGITPDGKWHYGQKIAEITDGEKVLPPTVQVLLPNENDGNTLSLRTDTGLEALTFDIIFPIIHGPNGEDGTLQGLLELANLPYVGSNVLGSAIAMDKVIQKIICEHEGIPQVKYIWFKKPEWNEQKSHLLARVQNELEFPVFVKPANLGSSVGITKVKQADQLEAAIESAFQYDQKVIIEQGIENMKEIEVAVLGNDQPNSSVCGSIKPRTEFYDYETKYVTDDIEIEIPANIPSEVADKIRQSAIQTFKLLNCSGLSRVDFFYQPETGKFYLSELNTLPGFTSISMYPKLWEATGISYSELISKLLDLAEERWQAKQKLKYTQ